MKYLDPPHLQLGFYWSSLAETKAWQLVHKQLLDLGMTETGNAVLVRRHGSALPRFSHLVGSDLDATCVQEISDWSRPREVNDSEWCTFQVELMSSESDSALIHLGYALLNDAALRSSESRVVEITFSNANCNLVMNVGHSNVSALIAKTASVVQTVSSQLFERICSQLGPTYALMAEECALQPPSGLLVVGDMLARGICCLAKGILNEGELGRLGSMECADIVVERPPYGDIIECKKVSDPRAIAELRPYVEKIAMRTQSRGHN